MIPAVTRTRLLELAGLAAGALLIDPKVAFARLRAPSLARLSVRNIGRRYSGDRRLFASVSPGVKGRDRASIRFALDRPATSPARGGANGTPPPDDGLADRAAAGAGRAPHLVEARREGRRRHLRDAADRRRRPREPQVVRRRPAGRAGAVDRPRRPRPRSRGRIREAQLHAARAGQAHGDGRLRAHHRPVSRVRHGIRVHRPRRRDARPADQPAALVRVEAQALRPAHDHAHARRVGQRRLRRQADDGGRASRLRSADPPARHARHGARGGGDADEHLAGVQLRRLRRRRLGRHLVRRREPTGAPDAALPPARHAALVPSLRRSLPQVPARHGAHAGRARRRRPRGVPER